MRYFLSLLVVVFAALASPPWAPDVVGGSSMETALFRSMSLPSGPVVHIRPPSETRENLTRLIEASPTSELHTIRAHEEERAGDYAAAEVDWKAAEPNGLADFYARRVEPAKEIATLIQIATVVSFARAIKAGDDALLSPASVYEAWIAKYPKSVEPYSAYLHWALQVRNREAAKKIATGLKSAFAQDTQLAVTTDAELAELEGGSTAALAVYSKNFSPVWPAALRTRYFEELTKAHQLRAFLGEAQSAAAAHPNDIAPVARIFFYYEEQKRTPAADAELLRFVAHREAAKAAWTPEELKTIAALFLRVHDYDESARFAWAGDREPGLAALVSLLLEVPEQPLNFANRDLSLYRNIATMDRHPGFLNGILTVALNTTDPETQYANASLTATSYFHRAAASRLLDQLKSEFPNSTYIPELEAELFSAYALYQQDSALLRNVPAWLARNVKSPAYLSTALLLADAYARGNKTSDETALYDALLHNTTEAAYNRVLDRYVARLVGLHRLPDALVLLRREIDRNPDEAALYERLALFVEQNHLDNDLEQTYRTALTHFKDTSWADKLARVYLRRKKTAAYESLSRQIADTFKGTQLAAFLADVPPTSPVLYRQVNLYAHRRFPHNMQFVTNLLNAYNNKATLDAAAHRELLRENWPNDPAIRTLYLQSLSRENKLKTELAALATAEGNTAALEFRAEAQSWLTRYEEAAPSFLHLAALTPGEHGANDRAITVQRSLGSVPTAVKLAQQDVTANPADRAALVRAGEILADREQFGQARTWWTRAAALHPGNADGYLDAATVSWDYLQFDDALRTIAEARRKLGQPVLFGYEAGAIFENKGAYPEAVKEYAEAVMHDSSGPAQQRLMALAKRPATRDLVETQTAHLPAEGFNLRVAILESQERQGELQKLLTDRAIRADTTEEAEAVRAGATRLGFDDIASQTLVRTVEITRDPIEKMAARLQLARFYEQHGNAAAASREYAALAKEEPNRLGVVRAFVDYQWRTKQQRQAVETLEAAANRAQPPYRDQFQREAAGKAAASGQFAEARRLLDQLLQGDRFNGDLLAQKAAIYAREGDNKALTRFYAQALTGMLGAPLTPDEKKMRVAALRRGYILALNTSGLFTEALEPYQAVLNAYPEDAGLAREASRFADAHQLAPRLVAYYEKAVKDAPRDYRWLLILARVETALGHYPEAVIAYDKAGYVRPDRSDIPLAKADLQMRLLRFQDVIKTYEKLYELSYHDRQYLASQADAYARLGNGAEAVRLLRAAFIELHPREPGGYVTAMQQANRWHLFEATQMLFSEVKPLLPAKPEWTRQAVEVETEALTAMHRVDAAINLIAVNIKEPEEISALLKSTGAAAGKYLTPAEKVALAQQMAKPGWLTSEPAAADFAEAAGLRNDQARLLLARARRGGQAGWHAVDQLQASRLLFNDLGRDLESLAALQRRSAPVFQQIERRAFQAYRDAGNTAAEKRLINYSDEEFARLFIGTAGDLNVRIAGLAAQNKRRANEVVERLITTGTESAAQGAIEARGSRLTPLWTNSYKALTGLYLSSRDTPGNDSFTSILGARTVAGQLAKREANVLPQPQWFYYAGRFSEYLALRNDAEAEDYRPAGLEASPAEVRSYVALGDAFAETKQWDRASLQYQSALELNPAAADVYDRLALLAVAKKDRVQALSDWREGLHLLTERVEQGPLPQDYWATAQTLLTHVNEAKLGADLKNDVDTLLRTYIKRNGTYETRPLLEGMLARANDRPAILQRIVGLALLPNAERLLDELQEASELLSSAEKHVVYVAQLAAKEKIANAAKGEMAVQAHTELRQLEIDYARYLEGQNRWPEAWARLQRIEPETERPADLLLTAAAMNGRLNEVLKSYVQQPDTTPAGEQLLSVAAALHSLGRAELALQLEEFAYGRELQSASASATAYFGLARVRFTQKRNGEGLALVRAVTLTVGAPFENLQTAVDELEAGGMKNDAALYAVEWSHAEPWNARAKLAASRLSADAKGVEAVRLAPDAEYPVRVQAARILRDLGSPVNGSDELSLLTHKAISTADASLPFAVESRLDAAMTTAALKDKVRLYREAIAIDPGLREGRCALADAALQDRQEALGLAVFRSCATDPQTLGYKAAAAKAANLMGRREDYAGAVQIYTQLLLQEKDNARRTEWTKAQQEVQAKERLRSLNLMRRPVVSEQVTQPQVVRPRLAALPIEREMFQ